MKGRQNAVKSRLQDRMPRFAGYIEKNSLCGRSTRDLPAPSYLRFIDLSQMDLDIFQMRIRAGEWDQPSGVCAMSECWFELFDFPCDPAPAGKPVPDANVHLENEEDQCVKVPGEKKPVSGTYAAGAA